MISSELHATLVRPRPMTLMWAFFERQINLWKRYWCWELVWLAYGVVNTLAITFIAEQVGQDSIVARNEVNRLVMFLLIGTLVWAYLSAVLDDVSLVVAWERWEGTIEHTLMAPVPRIIHLVGMSVFGVAHAILRTLLIFALAAPLFEINVANANWTAAFAVIAVGSVSVIGIAILAGILPLLYPERGPQMSFTVQAAVLLVSGVYYSVDVLPDWLRVISYISPATYILEGIRGALLDGQNLSEMVRTLVILLIFGAILIPVSVGAFSLAEKWAKMTGRLKRHG